MNNKLIKHYTALISALILWGLSFPAMKWVFLYDSPITIMFYRYLISFLFLLPFFFIKFKKYIREIIDKKSILWLGVFNFGGALLQFIGIEKTSSTKGAIITQMLVIIVPIFALFFLKEKLNKNKLIAIVISFIGAVILSTGLNFNNILNNSSVVGDILVLIGNFFWAFYIIFTRKFTQNKSNFILLFSSLLAMVFILTPISLIKNDILKISNIGIIISLFLAFFCTIFPTLLYNFSLRKIEASTSAIIGPIELISALIVSYFFLSERLSFIEAIGGFLILISFYLVIIPQKQSNGKLN